MGPAPARVRQRPLERERHRLGAARLHLAPSILDAAGTTPTTPQDGHSLLAGATRNHLLVQSAIIKNKTLAFLDKAATDTRPWFAYVTPYASHEKSVPYSPSHEVPFYLFWPAGGPGSGTTDSRIVATIDTWASYVTKDKQYTEYYNLHTDATGAVSGTGQVAFREYYDL